MRSRSRVDAIDLIVDEQLEDQEPEISSASDEGEDICSLSLVVVRAKTIDQVVVVEHVHHRNGRVGSTESIRPEDLAVMVEVESVDTVLHLWRQGMIDLLLPIWRVDPGLQFWLSSDGIAVDLVTTANHAVVRLLVVLEQQVLPDWVVSRRIVALEVVWVNTR